MLGDDEALRQVANLLIKHGGEDLDQFFPVFNCLLYHNRGQVLLNAMRQYTPKITPGKYFDDAEYELNKTLSDLIVLDYIETHAQSELLSAENFESLCASLGPYVEDLIRDALANFISWAGGITSGEWRIDDFQFAPPRQRRGWFEEDDDEDEPADPAVVHLRHLSFEFLHFARHTENISLTKADLARENLTTYILERHSGELIDEDSFGGSRPNRRSKKGRAKTAAAKPNPLLPDHQTLDRYLTRFYGFLANGTYEGAALFELIPTWTRYLQSKGLASEEETSQALRSLQALSQSMVQIMEKYDSDPLLAINMRKWRENAGI